MQFYIPSGTKRITISNGGGCSWEVMKVKGSTRRFTYRSVLPTVLIAGILLPFLFIRAAFLALEGASKCPSSVNCLGWKFGPGFFAGTDTSLRLGNELSRALLESKTEDVDVDPSIRSFNDLVADVTSNHHDIETFVSKTTAMLLRMDQKVRSTELHASIFRHLASIGIPKSMHCLCLRLAEEYSVNALARSPLPPPEFVSRLTDNSYHHIAVLSDNVLAVAVVVSSAVRNSVQPERMVFHVVTDKKTYAPMHAWFALHSVAPVVVEVKGLHQYDWAPEVNMGVMDMMEIQRGIRDHYYRHRGGGDGVYEMLEALRPSSVSLLNHLRIYLPELFSELDKIVFLDDDVVVQHDLSPLWQLPLDGKVNGAVSSSQGEGKGSYCSGSNFGDYLNFSHPVVSVSELERDKCAWLYGVNIFDLEAWRQTNITRTYHHWLQLNRDSGFTLWRVGALPPSLVTFDGHVHPIDSSWHVAGLGYQRSDVDPKILEAATVVHFSGPAKPWLEIGFLELRGLWSRHVNFSNEFIKSCRIME